MSAVFAISGILFDNSYGDQVIFYASYGGPLIHRTITSRRSDRMSFHTLQYVPVGHCVLNDSYSATSVPPPDFSFVRYQVAGPSLLENLTFLSKKVFL